MHNRKTIMTILSMMLLAPTVLTGCGIGTTTATVSAFEAKQGLVETGYVENNEINLNTKIPGIIGKVYVTEGQDVKAGDIIAEIDSKDIEAKKAEIEAKKAQAKLGIELTRGTIDAKTAQTNADLQTAYTKLEQAKAAKSVAIKQAEQARAAFEYAEKMYTRINALYEQGAVPASQKDEIEQKYIQAKQQYEIAKDNIGVKDQQIKEVEAAIAKAKAGLSELDVKEGEIPLAQQKYKEAEAGLAQVQAALSDTKIKAPKDGTLTSLNVEEGELVSTGMPIATLADLNNVVVNVKVFETDLQKVNVNQEVDVKFVSTGDKVFKGIVKRIAQKPEFATKKAVNSDETDILAYEVKVEINDLGNAHIFPGMTAYVLFPKQ